VQTAAAIIDDLDDQPADSNLAAGSFEEFVPRAQVDRSIITGDEDDGDEDAWQLTGRN
jgi:S-DNA-T family DNA segregation ATPase FtsK/SpoIIIE